MARPATGSIVERTSAQGTTFAARFRAYGDRQYVTLGHSTDGYTVRRAETELENILADVRRGIWKPDLPAPQAPPVDPTFHEFASAWFEDRRHEVAPRTVEDYQWALTHHLLPFFAKHRLTQITIAEVDRYRAAKVREREQQLVRRSLSNTSINATLNQLAQILELAVEYGQIPFNPARGRRRRLKAEPPKRSWLEPEQVKPLLDAAVRVHRGGSTAPDTRLQALLSTAICTGLRASELLALRWADIDLATGRLRVNEAKTDAGAGRDIDLWPELRDDLAAFKSVTRHNRPENYVFGTSAGRPDTRSNIAKRLKRTVGRANQALASQDLPPIPGDLSPHSLRRTFASLLYLRGETPVYVMEQMGHTDPQLALRIYAKAVGQQRRRGAGARLTCVLHGVTWTTGSAGHHPTTPDPLDTNRRAAVGRAS